MNCPKVLSVTGCKDLYADVLLASKYCELDSQTSEQAATAFARFEKIADNALKVVDQSHRTVNKYIEAHERRFAASSADHERLMRILASCGEQQTLQLNKLIEQAVEDQTIVSSIAAATRHKWSLTNQIMSNVDQCHDLTARACENVLNALKLASLKMRPTGDDSNIGIDATDYTAVRNQSHQRH